MSERERDPRVVLDAEAMLSIAPLREPNWDAFALAVEARLGKAGPTDDSLLLPPLPESDEDGREAPASAPNQPAAAAATAPEAAPLPLPVAASARTTAEEEAPASQREGGSLAELARAAIARRGTKEAVDLAKESFAIASQGRGTAEQASETIIATERDRRTVPPARRTRPAFDTRGPWIGVAVAAVGLAAGFGLYLSAQHPTTQIVEMSVPQAPEPRSAPTGAAAAEAPRVTPDMLPPEQRTPSAPALAPVPAEALARESAAPKASAPSAPATEARATAAPSAGTAHAEKVVLEEDPADTTKAKAQPPKAPASSAMRPAELNANSGVSDRPSTGAAQAAVGAVLGAARSCIAGQPQASSATIVFGSAGEVTSVGVSGPAHGTPAAACIQGALSKARVQPFAAPSFSLGVTIRPL
jgi:hypothetical protein